MTITKAPLVVLSKREPRGYVGPCCDSDCAEVATAIVELKVAGLIVTAWVCDEHLEALAE